VIWSGTKHGGFTVRSAYHMAVQQKQMDYGESSRYKEREQFWNSLWCLDAPASLKKCAWKVSHNILPTKENLFWKHIIEDPPCPLCTLSPESTYHILWSCPSSMAVWQEGSMRL